MSPKLAKIKINRQIKRTGIQIFQMISNTFLFKRVIVQLLNLFPLANLEALFLSGMARLLRVPDEVLFDILPPPRSTVLTFSGSLFNDYKGGRGVNIIAHCSMIKKRPGQGKVMFKIIPKKGHVRSERH